MEILDATLASPEANLALDEALLDALEEGEAPETLRFWESPRPFVVLGHGNRVATELRADVCRQHGIPILRRCSGGGAVLQGPGCLNYALTLRIPASGPLTQIRTTNTHIMRCLCEAIASLTPLPVAVRGITDLALWPHASPCPPEAGGHGGAGGGAAVPTIGGASDSPGGVPRPDPLPTLAEESETSPLPPPGNEPEVWLKFSGNAQRRKRQALLFHGSFLLSLDLDLLERVLAHPTHEPAYRAGRPHTRFVTHLPVSSIGLKHALTATWNASMPLAQPPWERADRLVREKYSRPEWNHRF